MDIEKHTEFGIRYHDFQFLEAKVHYPDSDPQMELVFSRDRERATTTRRLNDENTIQILGVGLAYLDEDRVPMVGLWNQDIERNKRLIAELWLFGVSYDFGIYSDRECWEICTHEQVYWYRDLLEKIIVQVSRMNADVDNLARTRPIVYSIRLQGQDAFLAMNLKLEDLEALYDESHVKGWLVQEVQKRYEQLQERLSPEKRVQVLGQPPGIDLTMENLDCFKQKLKSSKDLLHS
ncbi:hypothetical protein BJX62DRAFT_245572 [Aspergillus germanicus]